MYRFANNIDDSDYTKDQLIKIDELPDYELLLGKSKYDITMEDNFSLMKTSYQKGNEKRYKTGACITIDLDEKFYLSQEQIDYMAAINETDVILNPGHANVPNFIHLVSNYFFKYRRYMSPQYHLTNHKGINYIKKVSALTVDCPPYENGKVIQQKVFRDKPFNIYQLPIEQKELSFINSKLKLMNQVLEKKASLIKN